MFQHISYVQLFPDYSRVTEKFVFLAKGDWIVVAGRGMSGKWDAFKSAIARFQSMFVLVRVNGKATRSKEYWMTREIEALVRMKGGIGQVQAVNIKCICVVAENSQCVR